MPKGFGCEGLEEERYVTDKTFTTNCLLSLTAYFYEDSATCGKNKNCVLPLMVYMRKTRDSKGLRIVGVMNRKKVKLRSKELLLTAIGQINQYDSDCVDLLTCDPLKSDRTKKECIITIRNTKDKTIHSDTLIIQ